MDTLSKEEKPVEKPLLLVINICLQAIEDLEALYVLGEKKLKTDLAAQRAFVQRICDLGEALTFLRSESQFDTQINWICNKLSDGRPGFLDSFANARNLLIHDYPKETQPDSKTFQSILKRYEYFRALKDNNINKFKQNLETLNQKPNIAEIICSKPRAYGTYTTIEGPLDCIKSACLEIQRLSEIVTITGSKIKVNTDLDEKFHKLILDNLIGNICTLIRRYEELLRKPIWNVYHRNDEQINTLYETLSEEEKAFYENTLPSIRERIAHPQGDVPVYDRISAIQNILNIYKKYTSSLQAYLFISLLTNFVVSMASTHQSSDAIQDEGSSILVIYTDWYKAREYSNEELKDPNVLDELIKAFHSILEQVETIGKRSNEEYFQLPQHQREMEAAIFEATQLVIPRLQRALHHFEIKRLHGFLNELDSISGSDELSIINIWAKWYHSGAIYTPEILNKDIITWVTNQFDNFKIFLMQNYTNFGENPDSIIQHLNLLKNTSDQLKTFSKLMSVPQISSMDIAIESSKDLKIKQDNQVEEQLLYFDLSAGIQENDNSAVKFFLGNNSHKESMLNFNAWYYSQICCYLLGMVENQAGFLRVVFPDAGDTNTVTFKSHLTHLISLSNNEKKPAIFISKEPGASNHFICGIVYQKKLLLINPLGITNKNACYATLAELQREGIIESLWLSSNPLQNRNYEDSKLVSCGPITVELCTHILTNFTPQTFQTFWQGLLQTKEHTAHEASGLIYNGINIKNLLPEILQSLANANTKEEYQKTAVKIRKNHCTRLRELPQTNTRELNISIEDYLKSIGEESDEQMKFLNLLISQQSENKNEKEKLTDNRKRKHDEIENKENEKAKFARPEPEIEIKNKLEETENQLKETQHGMQTVKVQLEKLTKENIVFNEENEKLKKSEFVIKQELETAIGQVKHTQQALEGSRSVSATLEKKNEELKVNLTEIQKVLEESKSENTAFTKENQELKIQLTEAQQALEQSRNESSTFGEENQELKTQLTEAQQALEQSKSESSTFTNENQELKDKLAETQKALEQSRNENTTLTKENQELKTQLTEAQQVSQLSIPLTVPTLQSTALGDATAYQAVLQSSSTQPENTEAKTEAKPTTLDLKPDS